MAYQIDVSFVKPFVDGTLHTLKVQCSLDAKHGKPHIKGKREGGGEPRVDIAGLIGITSEQFKGSISICFPERTFLGVMGRMLGEKYDVITPDLEDGVGELINIIFGAAKRVLNEKGYSIQKALPSIIRGASLQVRHLSSTPTVVLPFETEVGAFHIEVGIEPV